jgi:KDO2-lipid IV(A) lauroyltransferase
MITLFEVGSRLVRWMPRPVSAGVTRLLGMLMFWLVPRVRRNTIANMAVVLNLPGSDPRVQELAQRSVLAFAEHVHDFLREFRLSQAELMERTVRIEGWEHFKELHEMRKGGIMITAHFGNWEWCGGLVSMDNPTHVVAETMRSRAVTGMLDYVRAKLNLRTIQLGNAAREILRALRRGEYVALLADRPTPGRGVEVEFFGRPAWVPEGAAALAQRAGSPMLVGGVTRNGDGTYTAHAMPPITWKPEESRDEAVQRGMQQVMSDLEKLIRRAPEQWYMFRPMWTTS